jgi:hypothetical protein
VLKGKLMAKHIKREFDGEASPHPSTPEQTNPKQPRANHCEIWHDREESFERIVPLQSGTETTQNVLKAFVLKMAQVKAKSWP